MLNHRRAMAAACLSVMLPSLAATGQPADALDTAVYAGRDILVGGFTTHTGAPTVAGNNLTLQLGQILEAQDVFLGGAYDGTSALERIQGDLLAVGNVIGLGFASAQIGGSVHSGGRVEAGAIDITGDIVASGDVDQTFSLANVSGNITSGGAVSIAGTIGGPGTNGIVTYNTGITLGPFASVNATVQGGPVAPPTYTAPGLPAPNTIVAGSNDVTLATFEDRALAPGVYGTLQFASGNTVTLSAGRYVFDDIVSTFSLNRLSFDTSGGPIEVLIEGDFQFADLVQVINGEALFAGGNPDPNDAADIWFEATGNITLSEGVFGTVYAPNGDITVNFTADVTGSVIAGRDVTFTGPADVTYVRTNVPEPGAGVILAMAGAALARRRRRGQ